jgi:hypothetical protein
MKKNRPGFGVRVLGRPADRLALARVLFAESTAIGVRASESDRLLLHREQRRVATPFGRIGVKVVWDAEGRRPQGGRAAARGGARRGGGGALVPRWEVIHVCRETSPKAAFARRRDRSHGLQSAQKWWVTSKP